MILPTKRISTDRSLLGIGAELLKLLDEPKTVSRLWQEHKSVREGRTHGNAAASAVTYEWFILTVDVLFMLGAVEISRGRIRKRQP